MVYSYINLRGLLAELFPYDDARGISLDIINKSTTLAPYDPSIHTEYQRYFLVLNIFPFSCPICYEEYSLGKLIRLLGCNHYYHMKCIDDWLQQKKMCPICLQDVSKASNKYNNTNKST